MADEKFPHNMLLLKFIEDNFPWNTLNKNDKFVLHKVYL